jgi:hypothetical protein
MEISIFAKKRTAQNGTHFTGYLSTLPRKDGTNQTVSVRFRMDCGAPEPEQCPMNIVLNKGDVNLSRKDFVNKNTGEVSTGYTLWVNKWTPGSPYVDHSLDEFNFD